MLDGADLAGQHLNFVFEVLAAPDLLSLLRRDWHFIELVLGFVFFEVQLKQVVLYHG